MTGAHRRTAAVAAALRIGSAVVLRIASAVVRRVASAAVRRVASAAAPLAASATALVAYPAHEARAEWLEGTVLADCEYCKTDEFGAERKVIANQVGPRHDPASGMGYVITLDGNDRFVWGRAALVGTGNLIRTDAHVLFSDTGELKTPHRKVWFEPMHHQGTGNLIEIDLSSVHRGGGVGPLQSDVKDDWAIARLREDAIEKFDGNRVFAFLWDFRITHDEIVRDDYRRASALVLSHLVTFEILPWCDSVTDDHPSSYAFGAEEIFFVQCPSEYLQEGSSGSSLAILATGDTWHLGGQLIGGGRSELVRAGREEGTEPAHPLGHQIFLGNVPTFRQTLNLLYLQELIRRGMDPRDR